MTLVDILFLLAVSVFLVTAQGSISIQSKTSEKRDQVPLPQKSDNNELFRICY